MGSPWAPPVRGKRGSCRPQSPGMLKVDIVIRLTFIKGEKTYYFNVNIWIYFGGIVLDPHTASGYSVPPQTILHRTPTLRLTRYIRPLIISNSCLLRKLFCGRPWGSRVRKNTWKVVIIFLTWGAPCPVVGPKTVLGAKRKKWWTKIHNIIVSLPCNRRRATRVVDI